MRRFFPSRSTGAVVFDFDGVFADSFDELYALNRDALALAGFALSPKGYRDLFLNNIHWGIERLVKDKASLQAISRFKEKTFGRYYHGARLFPFTGKFLRELSRDYPLSIVSSTRASHIRKALGRNARFFDAILGAGGLSKEQELKVAMRRAKVKPEGSFFISDTVGDIRIGKKLGMRVLGVTWGFHNPKALRSAGPERVFHGPGALLRYLQAQKFS